MEISRVYHDQTKQMLRLSLDKESVSRYEFGKLMDHPELLADKANILVLDLGIPLSHESYGLEWLDKIQKYYDEVNFTLMKMFHVHNF